VRQKRSEPVGDAETTGTSILPFARRSPSTPVVPARWRPRRLEPLEHRRLIGRPASHWVSRARTSGSADIGHQPGRRRSKNGSHLMKRELSRTSRRTSGLTSASESTTRPRSPAPPDDPSASTRAGRSCPPDGRAEDQHFPLSRQSRSAGGSCCLACGPRTRNGERRASRPC